MYITTRSKIDSYTAHRALCEGIAADGGQFIPMRLPKYTKEQVEQFSDKSFCDIVAEILNVFFSKSITGWDVEFAIGRKPFKVAQIGQKILVAETWRNTENDFNITMDRIYNLLCGTGFGVKHAHGWVRIAIRIAVMFGLYAELCRMEVTEFDVSVAGKDFEAAIAVWYAREMGLPVGILLCGCNENRGIWDLFNKHQLNFGIPVIATTTSEMDDMAPAGLERLVYEVCGNQACDNYNAAQQANAAFQLPEVEVGKLSAGIFTTVIGESRVADTVGSVYKTGDYFIDPYLAIACATLQDYRAKRGENRTTLLWAEKSATHYSKFISGITGVPEKEIINR